MTIAHRDSLLRRAILTVTLGLSMVAALVTWLNYRQVVDGLRTQSLKQMELYVKERATRESELFLLAEDDLRTFSTAWQVRLDSLPDKVIERRFHELFEQRIDGTRRLRAEQFAQHGITGVIRQQATIDQALKRRLVTAYDLLQQFGPAWRSRFENLYLALAQDALLMYWPENRWGLDAAPWEISMKPTPDQTRSPPDSPAQIAWSTLYYDYQVTDWMVSATLALSGGTQHRVGVDIPLNTLFARTVSQSLEGTYNMLVSNDGLLIAHPDYMDALLAAGGDLSLEHVDDTALASLYQRVKQYWREATIVDYPQQHEFLAVSKLAGPAWYLIIVFPYALIDAQAITTAQKTLALYAIALLCGLLLLYFVFGRLIAQPLQSLVAATERLAEGDLSTRVTVRRHDEIGDLGLAFNSMASRLEDALVSRDHLREAQEDLRESEQRFANLVEYSPDAIVILDAKAGQFVQANDNGVRLFGYTRESLMQMGLMDLSPEWQPDGRRSRETSEAVVNTALSGQPVTFEWIHLHATGKPIFTEVHLVKLPSREGQLLRGNLRDITERKESEKTLKKMKDTAEAANRAKSRFLAHMSHEFRTPLNAILGFTRLTLSDQDIAPLHKEHLIMVQRAGEHLSDLINDVLEMSKVESGRLELQETTFNLHELLQTLEGMIRLRAESKGLKVYFEIEADVPGCIKTDQRKLRQVLINLLSNAVKFTRAGAIHLSSRCVARLDDRLTLEFQVKDTGIGIPPADLGRLFEPFVQASTCNGNQEGTGLGLAISKQYVELMGGEISVFSGLGEGSRFCFTLQTSSARSTAAEHSLVQRRVIGIATGQPRFRQLIVEDKAENRLVLRRLLESIELDVREAEDGESGVALFEQWSPHLVWMDMRMPVMDGYEATRRIKSTPQGKDTVVVALTASAFEEQRSMILEAGCDDFVSKPYTECEIFDVLARHLGLKLVYQTNPTAQQTRTVHALEPGDLSALPPAALTELRQAAAGADAERLAALLNQIDVRFPKISDALRHLADEFRYEQILRLLEGAYDDERA